MFKSSFSFLIHVTVLVNVEYYNVNIVKQIIMLTNKLN